jgi:co-chaperonin GroES (HSP10)
MNMTNNFNLTTDGMQLSGKHFMDPNGVQNKAHLINADGEAIKFAQEKAQQEQLEYVNRVMEKDKDCKPYDKVTFVPTGNRVIVKPYDKNPYRVPLRETASGLILGDMETFAMHKSQETGEMEASDRGIWCCEVIAIGDECKYVAVGDDVYINYPMSTPIPVGEYKYRSINETNIICSIR